MRILTDLKACVQWRLVRSIALYMCCAATSCGRFSGGTTDDPEDPCHYKQTRVDATQVIAKRYTAGDFVTWVPPKIAFETEWIEAIDDGENFILGLPMKSTVHIEIEQRNGDLVFFSGADADLDETDPLEVEDPKVFENSCGAYLNVPVKVRLFTEDGLMNETSEVLMAVSPGAASFSVEKNADSFSGTMFDNQSDAKKIDIAIHFGIDLEGGYFDVKAAHESEKGDHIILLGQILAESQHDVKLLSPG